MGELESISKDVGEDRPTSTNVDGLDLSYTCFYDRNDSSYNPTQIYLHQISKTPLLSKEQEIDLSKDIKDSKIKISELFIKNIPEFYIKEINKRINYRSLKLCRKNNKNANNPPLSIKEQLNQVRRLTRGLKKLVMCKKLSKEVDKTQELDQEIFSLSQKIPLNTGTVDDIINSLRNKYHKITKIHKSDNSKNLGLSYEDLKTLINDMTNAQKERQENINKLVNPNLKLVAFIAKRYHGYNSSLLDLIQDGNIGLITAADQFDHNKGDKFSTYAIWWIKQQIIQGIYQRRYGIRKPNYLCDSIARYFKSKRELTQELNARPTTEQIARKMKISVKEAKIIELSLHMPILPLNLLIEEANTSDEFSHFFQDKNAINPVKERLRIELKEKLEEIIEGNNGYKVRLKEEQRIYLRYRFDIKNGICRTQEEVAKILNLTRGGASYREISSLKRLRCSEIKTELEPYLKILQ